MRLPTLPALLPLLLLGATACEEGEPWADSVSTGDLAYTVTVSEPQDFVVHLELDATDDPICDRLYLTLDAVILADAPEASIGVIHGTNVDMITLGLETGESIQLGDTIHFGERGDGGCVAEQVVRVATNAVTETVELRVDISGRDGSSDPTNHPGEGAPFTVTVTEI